MIKTLKNANLKGRFSLELYQEAVSNFTDWYNTKYNKDIDDSYVENRLRARTEETASNSLEEDFVKNFDDKDHIELSMVTRYERAK